MSRCTSIRRTTGRSRYRRSTWTTCSSRPIRTAGSSTGRRRYRRIRGRRRTGTASGSRCPTTTGTRVPARYVGWCTRPGADSYLGHVLRITHSRRMTAPTPRPTGRYGWIPDLPDHRDHLFSTPQPVLGELPPKVDLRPDCPKKLYDQGRLASRTANPIAAAFEFDLLKQALPDFMPSRLFIYYNERRIEGTINCDSGAMIRDGIKSVSKQGACTEDTWPYDIAKFADKPSKKSYTEALGNLAGSYQRVPQTLNQLRGCLAHGYPFVFGFRVYESFDSAEVARTGVVPLPGPGETALGGHAVLAGGGGSRRQTFPVPNSRGSGRGPGRRLTPPSAARA